MNWGEEQNKLMEQLEILKQLRSRFGEEVIAAASNARLAVHIKWLEKLSINKSGRPSEIFMHSAFSVTSAVDDSISIKCLFRVAIQNNQNRLSCVSACPEDAGRS